jgi:hypothetical protein
VTRLVVERLNAGDAAGVAALYEPEAVLAYPADRPTTGRTAIQAVYQRGAVAYAVSEPWAADCRHENLPPPTRSHRRVCVRRLLLPI